MGAHNVRIIFFTETSLSKFSLSIVISYFAGRNKLIAEIDLSSSISPEKIPV